MLSGAYPRGSVWDRITRYPVVPGYSNCGVVEEVGGGVEGFTVGDRVVSGSPHSEYVVVDVDRAVKVPSRISDEEAVFFNLAAISLNSVRLACISLGESVVVVGVGLIGQFVSRFARLSGGFPLVAVDLSDTRLEALRGVATATLNPRRDDVEASILEITEGRMADVVFEATGNPKLIPWELNLLRKMGRLILVSSPRGSTEIDFHDHVNWPSRTIIGAHTSSHPTYETPYNPWTWKRNVQLFFKLLSAGLIDVKPLISEVHRWTEAPRVYRRLLDPLGERLETLGVLLDFK